MSCRVHWPACNLLLRMGILVGDAGRDALTRPFAPTGATRCFGGPASAHLGGWHARLSGCRLSRASRLRFVSDEAVAYQLDGDPGGMLPVEVDVLPNRLTLLVP